MKAFEVISKNAGFRRIGRSFGPTPTVIPEAALDEDEIEALLKEPMLVVREIDLPEQRPLRAKEIKDPPKDPPPPKDEK